MNILTRIPEHLRGWFYLAIAVVFLVMLVVMFVVAVLNGDDLANWLPFILGVLGLAGSGLAAGNTDRAATRSSGSNVTFRPSTRE